MTNAFRSLILFMTVALTAGCAVHTKEQLAAIRSAGLGKQTVSKLENRGVLTPPDLIELKRRRVSDEIVIRHLRSVGVNYPVKKADVAKLRSAGVSVEVIATLVRASDRFIRDYYAPEPYFYYSYNYWGAPWGVPWGYPYYRPYFLDPWPYRVGPGFPNRGRLWCP